MEIGLVADGMRNRFGLRDEDANVYLLSEAGHIPDAVFGRNQIRGVSLRPASGGQLLATKRVRSQAGRLRHRRDFTRPKLQMSATNSESPGRFQGGENSNEWVTQIPDGAVSVETLGSAFVLRASRKLQDRFEYLLDARNQGKLTADENAEYDAICDLDNALSWINRQLRQIAKG